MMDHITTLSNQPLPYLFEKDAEGETVLTFGTGPEKTAFRLNVPDYDAKDQMARKGLPADFCNGITASEVYFQAVMQKHMQRGGQPSDAGRSFPDFPLAVFQQGHLGKQAIWARRFN